MVDEDLANTVAGAAQPLAKFSTQSCAMLGASKYKVADSSEQPSKVPIKLAPTTSLVVPK